MLFGYGWHSHVLGPQDGLSRAKLVKATVEIIFMVSANTYIPAQFSIGAKALFASLTFLLKFASFP